MFNCSMFNCSMFNCSMFNVQCSMFNVQCPMFNVQWSMVNVQCPMFNVQCPMFNCSMSNVQCSMFNGQWSNSPIVKSSNCAIVTIFGQKSCREKFAIWKKLESKMDDKRAKAMLLRWTGKHDFHQELRIKPKLRGICCKSLGFWGLIPMLLGRKVLAFTV